MLSEFIRWWAQQMMELLPARLTRRDGRAENALIVTSPISDENGSDIELLVRRNRRETSLGRFALDDLGMRAARAALGNRRRYGVVVLRVPRAVMLERNVVLPLAAERDVARVVEYEMDRFTPFAADEVFFAVAIQRRDRINAKLHLLVSLVPKAQLERPLAALAELGVAPTVVEAPQAAGTVRRVELGQPDRRRDRLRHAATIGAAAICALLAAASVVIPFVQQSAELDAIEAEIATMKPRVAQAETLRKQIANEANGSDVIAAEGARVGDALQAVAALTEILPDDTYLTSLSLRTRKLTMEGQSAAAAHLIAALSSDPVIRDAAFAAPVTRITQGGDIFSIRAELGP
jgi:general secretion pathway protein L